MNDGVCLAVLKYSAHLVVQCTFEISVHKLIVELRRGISLKYEPSLLTTLSTRNQRQTEA
jgi:hypothetical protein